MQRFSRMLLGVVLLGAVAGCGSASPEAGANPQEPEQSTETRTLSPDEVQALLDRAGVRDPGMMQAMYSTCQPSSINSCVNAGFGSCGSWSPWSYCGSGATCSTTICQARYCEWDPELRRNFCEGPFYGYSDTQNQYRVCFNSAQQPCTEWQLYSYSSCEC